MKAYRENGRLSVILKLSLPTAEAGNFEEFNLFYTSLAETYVKKLSDVCFPERREYKMPVTVTVGFENITEEYLHSHVKLLKRCKNPIVIKRHVRINMGGEIKYAEYNDIYDTTGGVFVK